jgi:hypothetical protein
MMLGGPPEGGHYVRLGRQFLFLRDAARDSVPTE